MSTPLTEEDQIFRLICCGMSYLGLVMHNGLAATEGGRWTLVRQSIDKGMILFTEARAQGLWPIVKDGS